MEEGLKIAEWSSLLCFLLTPPGGAGSAARMPARLLELFSPAGGSGLLGHREGSLGDDSSTGELLEMLKSDSWKCRRKQDGLGIRLIQNHSFAAMSNSDLLIVGADLLCVKHGNVP